MEAEKKEELQALVVGFLQQQLNSHPQGFRLQEFERDFPTIMDETNDWYRRYKKPNAIEALKCIPEAVTVAYNDRYGYYNIALNKKSEAVDAHLVDLITNQRSSKKGRSRPSSRARASFSLNRQYSANNYNRTNNYRSSSVRLNHGQQYRGENSFIKKSSPPAPSFRPSIYSKTYNSSQRMSSADPRNRGFMIPPQVRTSTSSSTHLRSSTAAPSISKPSPSASENIPRPATPKPVLDSTLKPKEKEEDPVLIQKRIYLRQRILYLLNSKFAEIKLLHLNSLYEMWFEESIEPSALGHQNLTTLMQDPLLSAYIQINYKSPFVTISARNRNFANGKENIASRESNKQSSVNDSRENNGGITTKNTITYSKAKLQAIDPFNVKSMLQSLEPLSSVKEPDLDNIAIDDAVKYKTMRIIFKSPDSTLKLDDWEIRFEQESRLKIRIRDYGFKTLLEFFKKLAKEELPINVQLNRHDEWVAVADVSRLSKWIHDKLLEGHYRAITAIDVSYELIAFPNDHYTYSSINDLTAREYHPAFILSVKRSSSIWIQLRTPKRIEEHLCVEASMSCYEDYKEKLLAKVPNYFIRPGFPCAVYDGTQQRWCRALILKAPEIIDKNYEITALLVDYAVVRNYAISQLSCLMKVHLKLPVGPVYSRLYGVKDETSLKVQQHAKVILQEYTSPPVTLACKFLTAIPSNEPDYLPKTCFEVTLVDTRHGKDFNLADDINIPCDFEGED